MLETRCDNRVEKMMKRGLLDELQQFHDQFNKLRSKADNLEDLTYHRGIWQSIGFKEFHDYLCLPRDQRETEEGRRLFDEGVIKMKVSTRQYSRKQAKWIRRRFLTNIRDSPPVFRVDSSDPALWSEKVFTPADKILQHYMTGVELGDIEPLSRICDHPEIEEDVRRTLHCDVCNRDLKGESQFRNHLKGLSHRKAVRALEEKFVYETKLLSCPAERKFDVANSEKYLWYWTDRSIENIRESSSHSQSRQISHQSQEHCQPAVKTSNRSRDCQSEAVD